MSEALHLFNAGGLVMYPLLLCSILVIAIGIERFRYYQKAESDISKLVEEIPVLLHQNDLSGLKQILDEDGGFPAPAKLPLSKAAPPMAHLYCATI